MGKYGKEKKCELGKFEIHDCTKNVELRIYVVPIGGYCIGIEYAQKNIPCIRKVDLEDPEFNANKQKNYDRGC